MVVVAGNRVGSNHTIQVNFRAQIETGQFLLGFRKRHRTRNIALFLCTADGHAENRYGVGIPFRRCLHSNLAAACLFGNADQQPVFKSQSCGKLRIILQRVGRFGIAGQLRRVVFAHTRRRQRTALPVR